MKNSLFLLLFLCLGLMVNGQSRGIEKFYQKYKDFDQVENLELHRDMLKITISGEDKKGDWIERVSHLRLMLVGEKNLVKKQDYRQLVKALKREHFDELMQIQHEGSTVDIYLREKGKTITDVIVMARGEDGFVLFSLEGLFQFKDLNDMNLNIEGAEHLKKLPDDRKHLPRA